MWFLILYVTAGSEFFRFTGVTVVVGGALVDRAAASLLGSDSFSHQSTVCLKETGRQKL